MTALFRKISKLYTAKAMKVVDIVLPPRCIVSGEIVEKQGVIIPSVWAELGFISSPQCSRCGIPFNYTLEEGSECAQCLENPPEFTSARAALRYDEVSRKIILGFKHGDKTHAVETFTPWMKKAGQEMLASADYLVPVPLHPFRLRMRRYNQSALMMFVLSKSTSVPGLPAGLKRIRATPSQGHKSIEERRKNVKKAFAVNEIIKERIQGKKIILIDDVFTTGATVNECTRVLLKAGAAEVHVLTLARVVKEEFL